MPADTNPDAVKLLSDDALREIDELQVARKRLLKQGKEFHLETAVWNIDTLCATVRALRAADNHHYQLWLDLKERHQHKFAAVDGKWSDTCQQCGVTTGDDHDGYDCIAWLRRCRDELQAQLAQVTQEPLSATIDILEQRRRQLGAESIPEYARTINFLQAIIDEKKKEYPPLRAAGGEGKADG